MVIYIFLRLYGNNAKSIVQIERELGIHTQGESSGLFYCGYISGVLDWHIFWEAIYYICLKLKITLKQHKNIFGKHCHSFVKQLFISCSYPYGCHILCLFTTDHRNTTVICTLLYSKIFYIRKTIYFKIKYLFAPNPKNVRRSWVNLYYVYTCYLRNIIPPMWCSNQN